MKRIAFSLVAIALLAGSARAIDLTVDFSVSLLAADGTQKLECTKSDKSLPDGCAEKRPVTFAIAAMEALGVNDQDLRGDEKARAGALAIRIGSAKKIVLTLEEATLLKRQVEKFCDPVTVARFEEALGQPSK